MRQNNREQEKNLDLGKVGMQQKPGEEDKCTAGQEGPGATGKGRWELSVGLQLLKTRAINRS